MLDIFGVKIKQNEDWFCTVFPKEENSDSLPQDFNSYEEAKAYGDEVYGEGNYIIESPCD